MNPNPILQKLGYSNNDRVVIFHADDINMSQASLAAYIDLVDYGLVSSAAAMAPCPWFPALARYLRENQGNPAIDIGVHLTLNSEWDAYRWGPISTADKATGLIDEEGYLFLVDRKKAFAVRYLIEGARGIGTRLIAILILQRETKAMAVGNATGSLVHVDANAVVDISQILLSCCQ